MNQQERKKQGRNHGLWELEVQNLTCSKVEALVSIFWQSISCMIDQWYPGSFGVPIFCCVCTFLMSSMQSFRNFPTFTTIYCFFIPACENILCRSQSQSPYLNIDQLQTIPASYSGSTLLIWFLWGYPSFCYSSFVIFKQCFHEKLRLQFYSWIRAFFPHFFSTFTSHNLLSSCLYFLFSSFSSFSSSTSYTSSSSSRL